MSDEKKGCKGCGEGPIRMEGSVPDDHAHDEDAHTHERPPVYIAPVELQSEYVWARKQPDTNLWDVEAMLCSTDIRFKLVAPDKQVRAAMADLENVARTLRGIKAHYRAMTEHFRSMQEEGQ